MKRALDGQCTKVMDMQVLLLAGAFLQSSRWRRQLVGVGSAHPDFRYFLFPVDSSRNNAGRSSGSQCWAIEDRRPASPRVVASRGTIVALRDDNIHLRVPPDNIRLEVARSAIVAVTTRRRSS